MMVPLALLVLVAMMNSVVTTRLRSAAWVRRSPVLGILAWQALTASILISLALAGIVLAFPGTVVGAGLAAMLRACVPGLPAAGTVGPAVGITGGLLAVALVLRVAASLGTSLRTARRRRRTQGEALSMASREHPEWSSVRIVDHPDAAVYCVAGRNGAIVFTSEALSRLNVRLAGAVLAHERAHLRERHDLVLNVAGALRHALPFARSMTVAHDELTHLVEMRADDVALRNSSRLDIANALIRLNETSTPAGALGASGSALLRMERLAAPALAPRPLDRMLGLSASLVMLGAPLAIAVEPLFTAGLKGLCSQF